MALDDNHKIPALLPHKTVKALQDNIGLTDKGGVEVGHDLEVDGNVIVNGADNIVDKDGNKIIGENSGRIFFLQKNNIENINKGLKELRLQVGDIVSTYAENEGIKTFSIVRAVSTDVIYTIGIAYSSPYKVYGYNPMFYINSSTKPNYDANIYNRYSEAKYQHTVTITCTGSTSINAYKVSFTAMSSKNTPIDSWTDLNTIFAGCRIQVSGNGNDSTGSNISPLYIDLHGGSISTDYIMFAKTTGLGDVKVLLSQTGDGVTTTYTDDVCIPK